MFFGIQALITFKFFLCHLSLTRVFIFFIQKVWFDVNPLTRMCAFIILANMGINFFLILIPVLTYRR